MTLLRVLAVGAQALVEDLGRPGLLAQGVPTSGALDGDSLRIANRILGNPVGAAGIEVLLGGLILRPDRSVVVAVAGAPCPVSINSAPAAFGEAVAVPAGAELRLAAPPSGLRSYLAVRGGIDVPPVLGSRSTDTSSGIGPAPLRPGDVLAVGPAPQEQIGFAPILPPPGGAVQVRAGLGPRHDLLTSAAHALLGGEQWRVASQADRIGVRLEGPRLELTHSGELPSAPIIAGAIQVPPSGQPIVFLADHPTTGGYPIVACVQPADLAALAQARPGESVRITLRANAI